MKEGKRKDKKKRYEGRQKGGNDAPLRFDEQVVEPHFHTALGLDRALEFDRLALLRG